MSSSHELMLSNEFLFVTSYTSTMPCAPLVTHTHTHTIVVRNRGERSQTDRRRRRVPIEACSDISEALYEERRGRQGKKEISRYFGDEEDAQEKGRRMMGMRVVPWPAVSYIHRYRRGEKGDKRGQRKMEIGREGRGMVDAPKSGA